MPDPTVAAEVHQSLDVHRHLAPQVTLDDKLGHFSTQLLDLVFRQFDDLAVLRDACCLTDLLRTGTADAVDRRQCDHRMLAIWNVDSSNTSHCHYLLLQR